jgi:type I restriction enzyme, S subunit
MKEYEDSISLVPFGTVCRYVKSPFKSSSLPYVGLEDIESNSGVFLGSTTPRGVKSTTFKFTKNNILYGRLRPYLNKVLLPTFDGHCSTEIFPIETSDKMLREYLFYWLTSPRIVEQINNTWTGARMPRANMETVKTFLIPLPPITEQTRIVTILDEAFTALDQAKANLERNLQNAKELFQSELNRVFTEQGEGWVERKLGEVCGFQNGFAFQSRSFKQSGTPVIRISNLQGDEVVEENLVYVNRDEISDDLVRYEVNKGDLLIAMSGGTTGKIGFSNNENTYLLNQRVGLFRPTKDLSVYFLYYYLSTKIDENLKIAAGSAQPNLSTEQIKSFKIPIPPIEVQEDYLRLLKVKKDKVISFAMLAQAKLAHLNTLKQSLLEQAFAGKL